MIVLVTGGASCGKSAFAEQVACALPGPHFYFAAMKPFGEEGARRIARHRALRAGKGFVTVECYEGILSITSTDLARELSGSVACQDGVAHEPGRGTVLLESLGNVVANDLFLDDGSCATFDDAFRASLADIAHVEELCEHVVIVGDEVGGDGIAYDDLTERYVRLLGSTSCAVAQRSAAVFECVAGQPLMVKAPAGVRSAAELLAKGADIS